MLTIIKCGMHMWKITKELFDSILQASKNTYPDEFLALIGGNKEEKILDELVVVPAIYGKNFSSIRTDLVPYDSSILGSVHSHPSISPFLSIQDLISFPRFGRVHILAVYPYNKTSIYLFNNKGERLKYEITLSNN